MGPDSTIGRTAAVMLGSTETTFYTIAVYFGAAGIKKTRYAVPAALCADLAGFFFAFTVRLFWDNSGIGDGQGGFARGWLCVIMQESPMRGERERREKAGAVALRFTAVPGKEAPLWRNGRCTPPDRPAWRGPARARALDKLGLSTVADLLAYFPREYEDRTVREGIAWLPADTPVCFSAVVAEPFRTSYIRKGMELTKTDRGRYRPGGGYIF